MPQRLKHKKRIYIINPITPIPMAAPTPKPMAPVTLAAAAVELVIDA